MKTVLCIILFFSFSAIASDPTEKPFVQETQEIKKQKMDPPVVEIIASVLDILS